MAKQGYVKTTIKSGAGSDLLGVSSKSKSVFTTGYMGNSVIPRADNRDFYTWTSEPSLTMSYELYFRGSNTKTIAITKIDLNYRGDLGMSLVPNKPITARVEVQRVSASSSSDPTGTYAGQTGIVKLDTSSPSPTASIRITPTGITNVESVFNGNVHSESTSVNRLMTRYANILNYSVENGKPLLIIGSGKGLYFKHTYLLGAAIDIQGTLAISWYEY